MKNTIKSFVLFSTIIIAFTSCETQGKKAPNKLLNNEIAIEQPATLEMSEDSIIIKSQMKAMQKVKEAREKIATEAIQTIVKTQSAVQLLANKNVSKATKQLKEVSSEIESIVKKYPKLDLLPIDVNVKTNDLITDISTVKQVTKDAEKALKNEQLQEARALLSKLSSEINITTVNVPLVTYPREIKRALKLIDQGKISEAETVLVTTLNALVIEENKLPIPMLHAEVLIDEAMARHLEDRTENSAIVINLLENADYQLKLAEVLGYGNKDKMYKELRNDIKLLKKSANSDKDLKELFNKLKLKVKTFRERLFLVS
ncbi:YfdX family protein [Lutibacter sp.]